jgi:biopolymer transport protein ExbB/TolQ
VIEAWLEILRPAGAFAAPLTALAAATFGLATWCALTLRARDVGRRERGRVRAALPLLGAFCSAGPLLGLLGTVSGLGTTFRSFSDGESVAGGLLADGVKQALFTSEIGLCIAIPGLLFHAALRRVLARRGAAQ